MSTSISQPTSDFVASTLDGALAAAATTATIGTGLDIPAVNGILQIDYDSTTAMGADNGPETISYAAYTTGTGALTGLVRGLNGTTDVAHANGAKVQAGFSVSHIKEFCGARAYLAATITDTTSGGYTKIALDTESYDVGANFASNKFTAPVNGYYQVNSQVYFASCTTAKTYAAVLYKDGAAILQTSQIYVTTDSAQVSTMFSDTVYLAAGSYLELYYNHTGATTVDIIGGAAGTFLSVALLKEV
jgi:hypothetical protein